MKDPLTPAGIEPATFRFVAQHLNHCATAVPNTISKRRNFMFCCPCISIYLCNKTQIDAMFILSLFRQSTSTCFGHICSPSSGGILYLYSNWYVLCCSVDCLHAGSISTRPTDSQLNSTTRINCCIYTVYLLMMGYKYDRNMYRLIDEIN